MNSGDVTGYLQGRVQDITSLADGFTKAISDYTELMTDLLEVVRCERINDRTKLLLILQQHGSKHELKSKIASLKNRVEEDERKLAWEIHNAEAVVKKKCFNCEACGGSGRVSTTKYIREREGPQSIMISVKCPTCKGEGNFKISQQIEGYIAVVLESVTKTADLGKLLMKISENTMALLST